MGDFFLLELGTDFMDDVREHVNLFFVIDAELVGDGGHPGI